MGAGAAVAEVWAEIWPQIGPRIDKVLATGEATWDERLLLFLERSGYTEETYHTFSYSPLADDDGVIRGMLCVVTEETARVIDERRLALLNELGAELAAAKTEDEVFARRERSVATDARRDCPSRWSTSSTPEAARGWSRLTGLPASTPLEKETTLGQLAVSWGLDASHGWETMEVVPAPEFVDWPSRPWDKPSNQLFVAPIRHQAQARPGRRASSAASNPYRRVDDKYRNFVEPVRRAR